MKSTLNQLLSGQHLTRAQAQEVIDRLINDQGQDPLTAEQMSALLIALRMKNETAEELLGFIDGISKRALQFSEASVAALGESELIDVCGTGGDSAGTFNVSTAVALVLASDGVFVAKHGNRGVSSRSGSSDVLEKLGIQSDHSGEAAIQSLRSHHVCFLFAPAFHPVLAKLSGLRKNLGVHTIFNVLGPLLNPAPLTRQLMGVYDESLLRKVVTVMREQNRREAMVVHGSGEAPLDEFTLSGPTQVAHLQNGAIKTFTVTPDDFGLARAPLSVLKGGSPEENAQILLNIFSGEKGPKRDLVLMNTAAALVLAGKDRNFKDATLHANSILDSGKTLKLVTQLKTAHATRANSGVAT